MNIKLLFIILRSRIRLILFCIGVTVLTAAVLTAVQPRRYIATASLVLSFEDDNPFEQAGVPAQLSSNFIATQINIIKSRKVALKVVEALGTAKDPEVNIDYERANTDNMPIDDWLALSLMANVTAEPMRNSRVVNISYQSRIPARAAKLADAFALAYIETTLEMAMEPARRNAGWFDGQLTVLRQQIIVAQAKLTQFQQEKGIISLDEKLGTETNRLNDISKGLVKAQEGLYDAQSRQLGKNHPEYRRAIERERSLRGSLDEQKKRILEIRNQRDALDSLAREVEMARQTYESTLANYYASTMESQFNQTNIGLLTPAITPQKPSSPNVALNMLSALFLGVTLSIILVIAIETLRRKIRTREDVQEFLNSPVLATI